MALEAEKQEMPDFSLGGSDEFDDEQLDEAQNDDWDDDEDEEETEEGILIYLFIVVNI